MQEWLKDKKNLPIIAGLTIAVLIGAIVLGLFETGVLPPQPAPTPVAASSSPRVLPPGSIPPPPQVSPGGLTPGAPSHRAVPGQSPAAAASAKTPPAPLNAAKGPDPFKVPGYHPFHVSQASLNASRVRNALPAVFIQRYPPRDQLVIKTRRGVQPLVPLTLTPEVSSSMRMSGVVTSDNSIKALLERNGVSTQVQPGDTVDGSKVISIQADGLTLRTSDNRLLRVPLSGTPTGGNSPYSGGGFPGNGFPGNGAPGFLPPGVDPNMPAQ